MSSASSNPATPSHVPSIYENMFSKSLEVTVNINSTKLSNKVEYFLEIHDKRYKINDYLGSFISIKWSGQVVCECGKKMKKFYRYFFLDFLIQSLHLLNQ